MAHFAKINSDNIVEQVIVISNDDIMVNGQESEQKGKNFISDILNLEGTWIQTSYNHQFRNKFAAIGDIYNQVEDIFEFSPERLAEIEAFNAEMEARATAKAALLAQLGITEEQARLLLS
jgi:hypothetical protein